MMGMEIIRVIDMPCFMNGCTILDENGDYNIYINAALSIDGQILALEHEREHIRKDDFNSWGDVNMLERIIMEGV